MVGSGHLGWVSFKVTLIVLGILEKPNKLGKMPMEFLTGHLAARGHHGGVVVESRNCSRVV